MTTFASAPRTCAVLQAVYTAAIGGLGPAVPPDVRATRPKLLTGLGRTVPEYRARMALTPAEFEELVTQEPLYASERFKPICNWTGTPGPDKDAEGHHEYVTFSSPIFSKKGDVAVVEVSFHHERGSFGYGKWCTVRAFDTKWIAQCLQGWVA